MQNHGEKTLEQLKEELRKRGAKVSGRKKELVERLEAYERNKNFTDSTVQATVYKLALPDPTLYKDVLVRTQAPAITRTSIDDYLSQFDKKLDEKAKNLYREKFLLCIRCVQSNSQSYIRGRCCAEMKKNIVYTVDIAIDGSGIVQEAQCECGAGMGPDAHCKHVCCILYGLSCFGNGEDLIVQKTCTEKLQTFHKCKKYKGSPLKASHLQLRKKTYMYSSSPIASFDPRPTHLINMEGYRSDFQNACINFQQDSRMSFLQLFPPANFYALYHDHDYFELTHEEKFLKENHLTSISPDTQKAIERQTQGQSKQPEWFRVRLMRISSSRFGRVCKAVRTDLTQLAVQMVSYQNIGGAALSHGLKYETVAVKKFEETHHLSTEECGTFLSISHPYLCSSSDRIVDSSTVLEVKCPFRAKNSIITPQTVPYLKQIDGELTLSKTHDYYYQVQGQMFCCNRQRCMFYVYTFTDSKTIIIPRDEVFIQTMLTKLTFFYDKFLKEQVLKKFIYRNYEKYTFDY